ncbi:DUF115 domain-containing protein [Puniceicoccaceae bacterium K14]|nr:DUF115 domain-containing protein [Puniceicoccaceae bacterium K14]
MSRRKIIAEVLADRFPRIANRVLACEASQSDFAWLKEYRKRSVDWVALCERWLDGVELNKYQAIALSGFGDGRHVIELLKRIPKGSYLFCMEENVPRFLAACEDPDVRAVLQDPRFFVGLGELGQEYFESLSTFPVLEVEGAMPLVYSPLFDENPGYYSSGFSEFAKALEYWRRLFNTNLNASGEWQRNTFENVVRLIGAPDVEVFRNTFEGCHMIIASAGPSLDESLDLIRRRHADCIVVAVNSSYRALRNAGIVPHFVLAADPYEYTAKGFAGVDCDGTVLLAPFIVYPEVVKRFEGRIASWSKNNVLASYLRLQLGLGFGSQVLELGTVSACIFDIAEIFGCKRLLFLGQDLGFVEDDKMHAGDTFYADDNANTVSTAATVKIVPGNTLESVKVDEKLGIYLKAFESVVRSRKGGSVSYLNSSRLGAKIPSMEYRNLEEAEKWISCGSNELDERLCAIQPKLAIESRFVELALEEMRKMRAFSDSLCRKCLAMAIELEANLSEEVDRALLEVKLADAESLEKELEDDFKRNPNLNVVLNDGALKYELVVCNRTVRAMAQDQDALQLGLREHLEHFWAIAEACFVFSNSISHALEKNTQRIEA